MKPKHFCKTTWHKTSLLLFMLNMLVTVCAAQVTISGKVTDEANKTLPGISVLVKGTTKGNLTEADGSYHLSAALRPGNYTISFTGVGFESKDVVLSVGSSASYTLDAALVTKVSKLDEVIV